MDKEQLWFNIQSLLLLLFLPLLFFIAIILQAFEPVEEWYMKRRKRI